MNHSNSDSISGLSRRAFVTLPAVALAAAAPAAKPSVCLFSKHLESITDYNKLADTIAQLGFDGVDLTVREKGHVEPARVEEQLPKAVEAIHKAQLAVSMITTRVEDAGKPESERVLKTASALGIHYYRRGGESWKDNVSPMQRIAELQPKLAAVVELNKKYNMFAGIHNHSGFGLDASLWALNELCKPFDARYVGSNFDVGHAVVEGGYGAWRAGFKLLAAAKRVQMVAVKDFLWEKRTEGWRPKFCPLGQGMVNLKTFFGYLKEINFAGPLSLHFEYKEKDQLGAMARDLRVLRGLMKEAEL